MSPEKAEVLAKAPVLESISWSVPALVGTKLYMRDRKNLVALDLGK
jgi:TPP-dependent 2-oxoacid decarboxylase